MPGFTKDVNHFIGKITAKLWGINDKHPAINRLRALQSHLLSEHSPSLGFRMCRVLVSILTRYNVERYSYYVIPVKHFVSKRPLPVLVEFLRKYGAWMNFADLSVSARVMICGTM